MPSSHTGEGSIIILGNIEEYRQFQIRQNFPKRGGKLNRFFAHVRDLKRLWGHLTHEVALMAANALVGSCLDYCNSLFRGLSALDLRKLQCVQNSLARIVANTTKYSHITPVRKALHWLPIKYRSIFKTAVLVYKFLHSGNPKYFEPFLIPRHSAYNTCQSQSDGMFLEVPHFASLFKS